MSLLQVKYDDIIAKANKRKELLQKMEELVAQLPEFCKELESASRLFAEFYNTYYALDQEGRDMLPKVLQNFCDNGRSRSTTLDQAIFYTNDLGHRWGAKAVINELTKNAS